MGDAFRRVGRSASLSHRTMATVNVTASQPPMMKPSNGPEPIPAQRGMAKQISMSSAHMSQLAPAKIAPPGGQAAAEEWHGEFARDRRSKSVAAGQDPARLAVVNSELQRRLVHAEKQIEEERRQYLATIRSLEDSLQDHRGQLQDERKVSAALNRDLLGTKNELAHSQQQQSGTLGLMAAVQAEQVARELKELLSRLDDLQRCVAPLKQLPSRQSQEDGQFDVSVVLRRLRTANQQLASLAVLLAGQQRHLDPHHLDEDSAALAEVGDIVRLDGPVTEEIVLQQLHRRFRHEHMTTFVGPVLVAMNSFASGEKRSSPLQPLYESHPPTVKLIKQFAQNVTMSLQDGKSLTVLLSGESGSGKTFITHMLGRQLFELLGKTLQSDAFKHYVAACTVLHPLCTARCQHNFSSSRTGLIHEFLVTSGAIFRTKFNCYHLDQSRVAQCSPSDLPYNIFYLMLAGITAEEKAQLQLQLVSIEKLHELLGAEASWLEEPDRQFQHWKMCLGRLGIPFMDVLRILVAVILLGAIEFMESRSGSQLDIKGSGAEIKLVAELLGVSPVTLYEGLTTRTRHVRQQTFRSCADPTTANSQRNALARALYVRMLVAIVRRINTVKQRPPPPPPRQKSFKVVADVPPRPSAPVPVADASTRQVSDRRDGPPAPAPKPMHHPRRRIVAAKSPPTLPPPEPSSPPSGSSPQHSPGRHSASSGKGSSGRHSQQSSGEDANGTPARPADQSSTTAPKDDAPPRPPMPSEVMFASSPHPPVTSSGSGGATSVPGTQLISVVDMFGFESMAENAGGLEQLCINMTSEALQQHYQKAVLRNCTTSCRSEGLEMPIELDFDDRSVCFQLLTDQHTGLCALLDQECHLPKISVDNFLQKLGTVHGEHPCLALTDSSSSSFTISHYGNKVRYDASAILATSRDTIPDDITCIFQYQHCKFGFVTHLFSAETKTAAATAAPGSAATPVGAQHRICPPTAQQQESDSVERPHSLIMDYQTRLDALLYTLDQAKPFYVRCMKTNDSQSLHLWEETCVTRQLRSLDVLDTVYAVKYGYSRQWPIKQFVNRFQCVLSRHRSRPTRHNDVAEMILKMVDSAVSSNVTDGKSLVWAISSHVVFFSEVTYQELQLRCDHVRNRAAVLLQSHVRGMMCRRHWPALQRQLMEERASRTDHTSLIPPPRPLSQSAISAMSEEDTTSISGFAEHDPSNCLYSSDVHETPPPVPKSRAYTVVGNVKLGFPQVRTMLRSFPNGNDPILVSGQEVHVIGVASRRGHILVVRGQTTIEVPHQMTQIDVTQSLASQTRPVTSEVL